jgi:hypothetical protein
VGKRMKKIIIISSIIICIISTTIFINAGGSIESANITLTEAKKVVVNHVLSEIQINPDTKWKKDDVIIKEERALFDSENQTSGYLFTLENKKGKARGYIVVNAKRDEHPIVEFSDRGNSYLMEQADKLKIKGNKSKIYYLGGLDYAMKNNETKKLYDLALSQKIDTELLKEIETYKAKSPQSAKENNATWEHMTTGSNPPHGDVIKNPEAYESKYKNKKQKEVYKYSHSYFRQSDFVGAGDCSPTTGLNLCYYWYCRNSYYKCLKYKSWTETQKEFKKLMKWKDGGGTPSKNVAPAYEKYFKARGISCDAYYYSYYNATTFDKEIDGSRPFHLMTKNHPYYGSHSLLALGYAKYTYASSYVSKYYRVADNWSTSTWRWVNTRNTELRGVIVRPK